MNVFMHMQIDFSLSNMKNIYYTALAAHLVPMFSQPVDYSVKNLEVPSWQSHANRQENVFVIKKLVIAKLLVCDLLYGNNFALRKLNMIFFPKFENKELQTSLIGHMPMLRARMSFSLMSVLNLRFTAV